MLVSLTVRNFKSIREARVRFGPVTCFVGHNGVGKSNLFDAVHFLSLLADRDISEAASEVRRTPEGDHSPLDLVFGRDENLPIELSADMIAPSEITDDFSENAMATATLLRYSLQLRYTSISDQLLVHSEELTHINLGEYKKMIGFKSEPAFRHSVAINKRKGGAFISTEGDKIMLHGDGGSRGRPLPVGRSPLTVLGGTNTADYPTVLAARREMLSWRLLHLEPSAMRAPSPRATSPHISATGGRIPVTLEALMSTDANVKSEFIYRLRQLNEGIDDIGVFVDKAQNQLALQARMPSSDTWLFGRSLSDGTLRYIALVLMLLDADDRAMLCLEEPENGIHPSRVPALVTLLSDYAVDVKHAVAKDNPLRQVAINTHSPEVARQFPMEDLIFVERAVTNCDGLVTVFRPVGTTWRSDDLAGLQGGTVYPIDQQSAAAFVGGSPPHDDYQQMELKFGSAT